ncbi:hypothetical protein OYT1_ch1582 [Ferriphaselus amnicola]|uniref:Uncharacterized protein n=1 Tax=Ferriphaselus amnicola TaxID=1188319 RepID=A0A2Z6GCT5_9PROT|nr:hypothetical protein [Ferriphaselus amnicola]BBE51129.1 hypothetical protein OYT1_ch1582 [Ferriphaselus amnicola]
MVIKIDDLPDDVAISQRVIDAIRSKYSESQEMKVLRMALAYPNDADAQARFAEYNAFVEAVRAEAAQARIDVVALAEQRALEAAQQTVSAPVVDVLAPDPVAAP